MILKMLRITNVIIFLFIYFNSNAQEDPYKIIIDDYCERARSINWENKTLQEVANQIAAISLDVHKNNKELIEATKADIRKKNPTFGNKQIEYEFSKHFTVALVTNCSEYVENSKKLLPPSPKENLTLKTVADKVDKVLETNNKLSFQKQMDLADKTMFGYLFDIEKQVNKDYPGGIGSGQLVDDVGLFVMHHSKYYFKAYLAANQLQQLEKQMGEK